MTEPSADTRFFIFNVGSIRPKIARSPVYGSEPSLRDITEYYYRSKGLEPSDAKAAAADYLSEWVRIERAILDGVSVSTGGDAWQT